MKKTINYELTIAEKQLLKIKKVSHKMLQDYALYSLSGQVIFVFYCFPEHVKAF
jgi:hypothetical protein